MKYFELNTINDYFSSTRIQMGHLMFFNTLLMSDHEEEYKNWFARMAPQVFLFFLTYLLENNISDHSDDDRICYFLINMLKHKYFDENIRKKLLDIVCGVFEKEDSNFNFSKYEILNTILSHEGMVDQERKKKLLNIACGIFEKEEDSNFNFGECELKKKYFKI